MKKHENMRGKLTLALLLFSSVPLIFLLLLGFNDQLDWRWVLAGAVVNVTWLFLFLRPHFALLSDLSAYITALREANRSPASLPQPPQHNSPILAPGLDSSLVETAEERDRRRREIEAIMAGNESILANLPDPLIMLDQHRTIVRANPAAETLYGTSIVGRDLIKLLRNPDVLSAADAAIAGRESREVEFVLPGEIDSYFTAMVASLTTPALDGTVAILSLHDLTSIKRAEQLRADFVANASHELRTPLASLLGFLETIRGPAKDDPEAQEQFLGIMHDQASRMSRLVEDLLSLSRIEMQEHTRPSDLVDLKEILNSVVTTLAQKAKDRRVTVDINTATQLPITGDRDELTQVFQNLIDNAIKYGKAGSTVTVRAQERHPSDSPAARRLGGPSLSITIEDQGEGIPRNHLTRLTERFYRVDTARSREMGGTGLGLAIVKHIVSRHKGLLTIDSTIGKGSQFTVHLPLVTVDNGLSDNLHLG